MVDVTLSVSFGLYVASRCFAADAEFHYGELPPPPPQKKKKTERTRAEPVIGFRVWPRVSGFSFIFGLSKVWQSTEPRKNRALDPRLPWPPQSTDGGLGGVALLRGAVAAASNLQIRRPALKKFP